MSLMKVIPFILTLLLFILVSGCRVKENKMPHVDTSIQHEVLIYCENSMVPVILELANEFEKKYHCRVKIQNDCAQNLIGLINYSKKGDLFIPSSIIAFKQLRNKTGFSVTDSTLLGYNRLVFMVKKGNPSKFNGDTKQLIKEKHAIIIANPETSSLGLETQKYLKKNRLYERVLKNVVALSADYKGLVKSLSNNQADIALNWKSVIYINGNKNLVDFITIDSNTDVSNSVYAGLLSTSDNKELARVFLSLINSNTGRSILTKHGFSKRKTFIF
ncbi:molybdate ABC transporter substrate-binding protein [Marinilabiliaceae bacterium JC017]|nr:molybdate ABC transporter substrate-binding protein [Marinilabiliaceae bacterium JC017]